MEVRVTINFRVATSNGASNSQVSTPEADTPYNRSVSLLFPTGYALFIRSNSRPLASTGLAALTALLPH